MTPKELRKLHTDYHSRRLETDGWRAAKELAEKELAARVRKWGLNSPDSDLDQITRLQLRVQLLPAKIADMEVLEAEMEEELRAGANAFVSKTLAPLIREKTQACDSYLREKLVDVIAATDSTALQMAILDTKPMRQLSDWGFAATVDHGFKFPQAADQAAAMLDLFTKVEAYDFRKVK